MNRYSPARHTLRVVAVMLLVILMAAPGHGAFSWAGVTRDTQRSVVRLELSGVEDGREYRGMCSAFSINRAKNYYLTVGHCYGQVMRVGQHTAHPIFYDYSKDLMVVWIPGITRPALKHAKGSAAAGTPVAAVGFAGGLEQSSVRVGAVAVADILMSITIGGEMFRERFVLTDFPFIGGQSGGPLVNQRGEVISVLQASNGVMGLGRPLSVVLGAVESYWE